MLPLPLLIGDAAEVAAATRKRSNVVRLITTTTSSRNIGEMLNVVSAIRYARTWRLVGDGDDGIEGFELLRAMLACEVMSLYDGSTASTEQMEIKAQVELLLSKYVHATHKQAVVTATTATKDEVTSTAKKVTYADASNTESLSAITERMKAVAQRLSSNTQAMKR